MADDGHNTSDFIYRYLYIKQYELLLFMNYSPKIFWTFKIKYNICLFFCQIGKEDTRIIERKLILKI